jgi:hypothetical protein
MYFFVFIAIFLANVLILLLNYLFLRTEDIFYYRKKRKLRYRMKKRYRELLGNKRNNYR